MTRISKKGCSSHALEQAVRQTILYSISTATLPGEGQCAELPWRAVDSPCNASRVALPVSLGSEIHIIAPSGAHAGVSDLRPIRCTSKETRPQRTVLTVALAEHSVL